MYKIVRWEGDESNPGIETSLVGTASSVGKTLGLIQRDAQPEAGLPGNGQYSVFWADNYGERIWASIIVEQGSIFSIRFDTTDGNWADSLE